MTEYDPNYTRSTVGQCSIVLQIEMEKGVAGDIIGTTFDVEGVPRHVEMGYSSNPNSDNGVFTVSPGTDRVTIDELTEYTNALADKALMREVDLAEMSFVVGAHPDGSWDGSDFVGDVDVGQPKVSLFADGKEEMVANMKSLKDVRTATLTLDEDMGDMKLMCDVNDIVIDRFATPMEFNDDPIINKLREIPPRVDMEGGCGVMREYMLDCINAMSMDYIEELDEKERLNAINNALISTTDDILAVSKQKDCGPLNDIPKMASAVRALGVIVSRGKSLDEQDVNLAKMQVDEYYQSGNRGGGMNV